MSSVGYHEPFEELSDETRDMHRAIVSLMEELEAVDWYNQRADVCKDEELKAILVHNRDEEKNMPPWFWSGFGAKIQHSLKNSKTTCSPRNQSHTNEFAKPSLHRTCAKSRAVRCIQTLAATSAHIPLFTDAPYPAP
ncbi:MAG: hypothetical protein M5R42_19150 [Rhodocyclaceae bacterium]|nr:hypothetical protein [Rhodocyclaceae bacterium]